MSAPVDKNAAQGPPPASGRFSLHRLSAAFARLTGSPEAAENSSDAGVGSVENRHPATPSPDHVILSPRMIVEGMLFVGHADGRPLTNRSMASHIRDVSPQEVDAIIVELNEVYARDCSSYTIVSDGAGYRMQLRPEHGALRQRLSGRTKQAKLTPQAIEVLSIVAYRQPISADGVSKARGARSDALLSQLIRRGLLRLERSGDASQRVYCTTSRFNQLLNINSPAELPKSEDLDDN